MPPLYNFLQAFAILTAIYFAVDIARSSYRSYKNWKQKRDRKVIDKLWGELGMPKVRPLEEGPYTNLKFSGWMDQKQFNDFVANGGIGRE